MGCLSGIDEMKTDPAKTVNEQIEKQFHSLCREMDDFMNDDLNTAKVLANMFQLVNHINSFRSGDWKKQLFLPKHCLTYNPSLKPTWKMCWVCRMKPSPVHQIN